MENRDAGVRRRTNLRCDRSAKQTDRLDQRRYGIAAEVAVEAVNGEINRSAAGNHHPPRGATW